MTTVFTGRTRAETKRKALAFWVENREPLRLSMTEFFDACTISPDGTSIAFQKPQPAPMKLRLLRAFGR